MDDFDLECMQETVDFQGEINDSYLHVGACVRLDDGKKIVCHANGENKSAWALSLKKRLIKLGVTHASAIYLSINTFNKNGFDLNKLLEIIKVDSIYVGLPDPELSFYSADDPVVRLKNVFRYPDSLQKVVLQKNSTIFSKSRQNIRLSPYYFDVRISKLVQKRLSRQGIELSDLEISKNKTASKLARYLVGTKAFDSRTASAIVNRALSEAFNEKYGAYDYRNDARFLSADWADNFRKYLGENLHKKLASLNVLNVGVGSGKEARILFSDCRDISFVDIASGGLKVIKRQMPWANVVKARAEKLADFADDSFDVYISLRTYNSSFFDAAQALLEACRVLRSGGVLVLSVANGFLCLDGNILPGLIIPGMEFVDIYRGLSVANYLREECERLGFRSVKIYPTETEIYVIGKLRKNGNVEKVEKEKKKVEMLSEKIIKFYRGLSKVKIDLPKPFRMVNPFALENAEQIRSVSKAFYSKFYSDNNKRIMILGSSPARRGTAVTGIPFEDAQHLFQSTGIEIPGFHVNKASSNFLYDVIDGFGGAEKFYSRFYLSFVCPLGVVRENEKGGEVNCNYYENKALQKELDGFMVESLKKQMEFNIDRSVCFCIGSGENFRYLESINSKYKFFDRIVPLEHPRFIMQYNSKDKDLYLKKYLDALNNNFGD